MDDRSDPKRRLEEVLPTPVRVDARGNHGPRARVVSHVRKLAMGTVGLATMGCTGFGVVDPIPRPSRCIDVQSELLVCASYVSSGTGLAIMLTLRPSGSDIQLQTGSYGYASGGGSFQQSETLDSKTGILTIQLTALPASGTITMTTQSMSKGTYGSFQTTLTLAPGAKSGDAVPLSVSAQ